MTPVLARVFAAQGPSEPSVRVRTVLPKPFLAAEGVVLEHMTLFSDDEAARFAAGGLTAKANVLARARRRLRREIVAGPEPEVALIHRRADLLPSLACERRAARAGRLVLDVDDPIWLDARRDGAHALAALKGSARKLRWLAGSADRVLAGNASLAEWLEAAGAAGRVTVVPSLVDIEAIPVRRHGDAEELVIGWIGSETTAPFVAPLRETLGRAAAALAGRRVTLLMVGGRLGDVPGVEVEARAWSPQAELEALAKMDVGIMPLPNTAWNRGKCAYKALQYMAAGVPVVADDVGVAAEMIAGGGVVVHDDAEWMTALVELLRDAAERGRLGGAARQRAQGFSLRQWAPKLAALLRGESEA